MRLRADLPHCIAFIGVGSGADFVSLGTGFFVGYGDLCYLVTARHVVDQLEDHPFVVRVNRRGVGTVNWHCDPLCDDPPLWRFHSDETVDVATMLFLPLHQQRDVEAMSIPEGLLAGREEMARLRIGVGDICYAVGLFRLLRGENRNLPFVHTGNIGLIPPKDEKIPTKNWRPSGPRTLQTEGYLIELTSLAGLSGSPIFARPTFGMRELELNDGTETSALLADERVLLIGVWQGAWDGDPDDVLRHEASDFRVPVGIGVVTPIDAVIAIFESAEVVEERVRILAALRTNADATPD